MTAKPKGMVDVRQHTACRCMTLLNLVLVAVLLLSGWQGSLRGGSIHAIQPSHSQKQCNNVHNEFGEVLDHVNVSAPAVITGDGQQTGGRGFAGSSLLPSPPPPCPLLSSPPLPSPPNSNNSSNTSSNSTHNASPLPASCIECAALYRHEDPAVVFREASERQQPVLFDFAGDCPFGGAYFHTFYDRLVPSSSMLHALSQAYGEVHVYLASTQASRWLYLAGWLPEYRGIPRNSTWYTGKGTRLLSTSYSFGAVQRNMTMLLQPPNRSNYSHVYTYSYQKIQWRSDCTPCFQEIFGSADPVTGAPASFPLTPPTCDSILIGLRLTSRRFIDADVLLNSMSRVARYHNLALTLHFGNESLDTTMGLYSRACAVVLYHGAGSTNVLFTKGPVHVLEVTTYMYPASYYHGNESSIDIWRTSQHTMSVTKSPVTWEHFLVDHSALRPLPPIDHPDGKSFDWDHMLKSVSVELGRGNADNMALKVDAHLRHARISPAG